jgi:hypothetical protein
MCLDIGARGFRIFRIGQFFSQDSSNVGASRYSLANATWVMQCQHRHDHNHDVQCQHRYNTIPTARSYSKLRNVSIAVARGSHCSGSTASARGSSQ